MGTSTTFAGQLLGIFLNGTPIANIADNAASAPLADLQLALHSADPGAAGNQTTNEVAYTGYARLAISRSSGSPAWTITGDAASPNTTLAWPACTGGTDSATYWSIGTAATGTGEILWSGTLSPTMTINDGVTPQLTTATTVTQS